MRQGTFMSTKKRFLPVLPFLALIALLGSCVSTPHNFDESLHDHEVAVIHFRGGGVNIVDYNSIPVRWNTTAFIQETITLRIPGGDTAFVLDGRFTGGSPQFRVYTNYNMVPFQFAFQNGSEYTVRVVDGQVTVHAGRFTGWGAGDHIATFDMRSGEQRLTISFGESVAN